MDTPTPLIGVPDVAVRLNLSERTVRRLVQRGEIPAVRLGGNIRFEPADLEAFITASKVSAA